MIPDLKRYGLLPILPDQFDHQVTGTFGECERMAYYKHILGRQRAGQDKTALNWGKTMHTLAELWANTQDPELIQQTIESSLDANEEDRYGRTRGRMFEAFLKYAQFQALNPIEVLRTEQPTSITCDSGDSCPYFPGTGCGLSYGGRIDKIVRWQGMVGPLDIKTTIMDDKDPIMEYRPSHQFEGYVWVVSHLMDAHSWGLIVDRIVTNKSSIKINRIPVSFNRDNIRDWVENEKRTQARIHNLMEVPEDEYAWIQNKFRCAKPYPCEFRDACLSPVEEGFRYKWLAQNTVEKRWDFRHPELMDDEVAPNA